MLLHTVCPDNRIGATKNNKTHTNIYLKKEMVPKHKK